MKVMKRLMGVAALATAATTAFASAANAEVTFTGNVALTSDYVFRGISQTQSDPAIQGGMDATTGIFYAGVWGSSLDFGSIGGLAVDSGFELDLYAGVRPVFGPVTFDIGVIGYLYPGSDLDFLGVGDVNYWEIKAGASIAPVEGLTIGGALYYSPEFTLGGGDSLYAELNAAYTINEHIAVSGALGNQSVDTAGYFFTPGTDVDSYTTWNLGATLSAHGFGLDLRYFDASEDIENLVGEVVSDERFVATLRRAF